MQSVSTTVTLPEAPNAALVLIQAAQLGVAGIWREAPGDRLWRYSKAGITTTDLMHLVALPRALIGRLDRERSGPLIAAMDTCNGRFGRGTVVPAWGLSQTSNARKNHLSAARRTP